MKVGDLVENQWGEIGIVLRQVGVVDRWVVHWMTSTHQVKVRAHWTHDLYPIRTDSDRPT